jgi:hypothetical protein
LVKKYLILNRIDKNIAENFQEIVIKALIVTVYFIYLLHLNMKFLIKEIRQRFLLVPYDVKYWIINAVMAEDKNDTL